MRPVFAGAAGCWLLGMVGDNKNFTASRNTIAAVDERSGARQIHHYRPARNTDGSVTPGQGHSRDAPGGVRAALVAFQKNASENAL